MNILIKTLFCLLFFSLISTYCLAADKLPLDQLQTQLLSPDEQTRRDAIHHFTRDNWPATFGEGAIEVIVTTLKHPDEYLRALAIEALLRMGLLHNQHVRKHKERLKPLLITSMDDSDSEVAGSAMEIFPHIYGSDSEVEELLFSKFNRFKQHRYHQKLLRSIALHGVESKSVQKSLLQLLNGDDAVYKAMAGSALLKSTMTAEELLPSIMNAIETPKIYAKSHFVTGLKQFGDAAKPYLPRLYKIKDRILREQYLPRKERTIKIYLDRTGQKYEDSFVYQKLVEVIRYLEDI